MRSVVRVILVAAIGGYRAVPGRFRHTCPRGGASCSELGLAAARAGGGVAAIWQVLGACVGDEGCSRTWD